MTVTDYRENLEGDIGAKGTVADSNFSEVYRRIFKAKISLGDVWLCRSVRTSACHE